MIERLEIMPIKKLLYRFGLTFLTFLVLCMEAYPLSLQQTAGNSYDFWEGSDMPINYMINTGTIPAGLDTAAVVNAIQQAFQAWQTASGGTVSFVYDGTTDITAADPLDGKIVYWINSSWPLSSSRMANTVTHAGPNGKLVEADVQFNGQHFSWSASAVGESGKKDVQNVATHEVGHFIGIDHSDDSDATM